MLNLITLSLICTGVASTSPRTNVEIEINTARRSTIRYEIAEGSLKGTAYMQTLGRMSARQVDGALILSTEDYKLSPRLVITFDQQKIAAAHFTHYSSGMQNTPVDCDIELQ